MKLYLSLVLAGSLAALALAQDLDEAALYPVPEESKPKEGVTYGEWVKKTLYGKGVQENYEYGELISIGG